MTKFVELFNQTGVLVLLENCNNDRRAYKDNDGKLVCPMHLYRTGGDARASYGAIIDHLYSALPYNQAGLSGPGCWAYPDMLEVGNTHNGQLTLSYAEAR